MTKKDFSVVTLIGFLIGCLALLPLTNIGLPFTPFVIIAVVLGCTAFAGLALFILNRLSRRFSALAQFGKFAAVGTLNALLDLGLLNLLMFLTNVSAGIYFTAFKTISAFAGKNNSYFWNKFWAFEGKRGSASWREQVLWKEYLSFITFTLIGLIFNVAIATVLVNTVGAPLGMDARVWANIASVIAMLAAMLWNFFSYRWVVFKNVGA